MLASVALWALCRDGDVAPRMPAVDEPRADVEVAPEPAAALRERDALAARAADGDAAAAALPPDADLTHPFSFALDLVALDNFALPVADAMVFVAPSSCGFSLWPERTDRRGRVRLAWSGRARAMELQVAVVAWGVLQPLRLVRCEAGETARLAVAVRGRRQSDEVVAKQRELAGKSPHERAAANFDALQKAQRELRRAGQLQRTDDLDVLCGRTLFEFRSVFVCTDCHQPERVQSYSMLARAGTVHVGLHPFSGFHDLRARPLDSVDEARRRDAVEESAAAGEPAERAPRRREQGVVQGVVYDEAGAPVADAPVVWLGEGGVVERQTRTRGDGRYTLDELPTGTIELLAGGGCVGVATAVVHAAPAHVATWDFRLEGRSVVRGDAVDADDAPLRGWRVEATCDRGDWAGWTKTDRDGGFRFYGVPAAAQCLLWPADDDALLPILFGTTALVDAHPVRLALRHENPTRARLRVHPSLPTDYERLHVDARLVQVGTGFVAQVPSSRFDRALEVTLLPPGEYRLQLGAPGLGWVEADRIVLDGRGLWDIGGVSLPRPGGVRVRAVGGLASPLDGTHGFYRRTPSVDVRVEATAGGEGDAADERTLPPDDYVLVWQDGLDVRAQAFRVRSGAVTELVVGPRR